MILKLIKIKGFFHQQKFMKCRRSSEDKFIVHGQFKNSLKNTFECKALQNIFLKWLILNKKIKELLLWEGRKNG